MIAVESGVNIAMTRACCAACGKRVPDAVPKKHNDNIMILGSQSCTWLEAMMPLNGAGL
ncbi:MAG TPA: hypothetical protein VIF82_08410 [Burkholderiaceae bacterium]